MCRVPSRNFLGQGVARNTPGTAQSAFETSGQIAAPHTARQRQQEQHTRIYKSRAADAQAAATSAGMADVEEHGEEKKGYQLQSQHTYKIISSYLPESYEQDAITICIVAVDKFKHLKDIAFHIKHEYDKKYPGSGKATEGVYHCAVGKSFASEWRGFAWGPP